MGTREGRAAYAAYCESVGGVSIFTGATLPPFDDQDPRIQEAWNAAGRAAASVAVS